MILKNKILPFRGFAAMAVWPIIFVRNDIKLDKVMLNHEKIHFEQQKELWIIGFYILYLIFWIKYGYRNIPFEKEAYENEQNRNYLDTRNKNNWLNYLKK